MTALDIALIVFMLISALLAMMRGFTREVLTIVAWGLAAAIAFAAFLDYRPLARQYIQPDMLADAALIGGSFFVVLIITSFASMKLSDFILDSKVGAIDRSLGFAFGALRGLLIAVIAFQFYIKLGANEERQPAWIKTASLKPLLVSTGNQLFTLLPEDLEEMILKPQAAPADSDTAPTPDADGSDTPE